MTNQTIIFNWVDEILNVASIMAGINVDIMLASGTEIRFPGDIFETIRKRGAMNEVGKLIVSRGVVAIGANQNDSVEIIIGEKIIYAFGSKRN